MEEFLIHHKSEITRLIEIATAVVGLFLLKKYKGTDVKYFIYFLVYLSIGDFINTYTHYISNNGVLSFLKGTVFENNYWWSTLFWKIGAILFFAFYYNKVLKRPLFKIIIKLSGYTFFIFSIIYIIINWKDYFILFFPVISIFGTIIVFICSVFYFIEILQSDRVLTFYKTLNFYISVAIFIWWLVITPIVFYDIYQSYGDRNFTFLKWKIYLFANIFMYSTFTFALIFCKPENDIALNEKI